MALSPGHLVVLGAVALVLVFGWKELPDMSRNLGRSLRIFRTELKDVCEDAATITATITEQATPTVAADRPWPGGFAPKIGPVAVHRRGPPARTVTFTNPLRVSRPVRDPRPC